MERIVRRSEFAADDSPASSPEPITGRADLALDQFEFVHKPVNTTDTEGPLPNEAQEDELEFCLFAPTATTSAKQENVARIRLESPEAASGESGFVQARRHEKYFFTGQPDPQALQEFELAAVTGADVLARSKSSWPGSSYAWKVMHLPADKKQRQVLAKSNSLYKQLCDPLVSIGHKRKGKTARLKIRKQFAARQTKLEAEKQAAAERDILEREKRTRRNREKKVKKKLREKANKLESTTPAATSVDGED